MNTARQYIRPGDALVFVYQSLHSYRLRTVLILLAMAIGIASVIVLSALGEGARRYVTGQFSSLGSHLLIVLPGRNETSGGPPPIVGEIPRDLTLDDALALGRSNSIRRIAPIVVGSVPVSWERRDRETTILGSTPELLAIRHWKMAQGRFLPPGDPRRASPECVIGAKIRDELFGPKPALGQWLRIGDRRFRVGGVLVSEGTSIGVNTDEVVIISVASAMQLFNSPSLFRILVEARTRESIPAAKKAVLRIIRERHEGEDDITVITQDAVLSTFDRILSALTYSITGIAGISLIVAGILIMNIMLVAVSQRRAEIGLMKAVGAPAHQILRLFLFEAITLSSAGGVLGLAAGLAGSAVIGFAYPVLPAVPPWWSVIAALLVATGTGILFGVIPARRAAALDPIEALSRR